MLFGRRKPGFVQEVNDNSESTTQKNEKPELLDFLSSLPEQEDEFVDIVQPEETEEVKEDIIEELTESEKLAEYIRTRSAAALLTKYSQLEKEISDLDKLLEEIKDNETCQDITCKEGNRDKYYYSTISMSDNYAMIISLVEDKDLVATIAKMVRFNCKTYPAPTPLSYFEKHPYYATKPQIERAVSVLTDNEEYSDIQRFTNNKDVDYLFSTQYMSLKYANALARVDEFTD